MKFHFVILAFFVNHLFLESTSHIPTFLSIAPMIKIMPELNRIMELRKPVNKKSEYFPYHKKANKKPTRGELDKGKWSFGDENHFAPWGGK